MAVCRCDEMKVQHDNALACKFEESSLECPSRPAIIGMASDSQLHLGRHCPQDMFRVHQNFTFFSGLSFTATTVASSSMSASYIFTAGGVSSTVALLNFTHMIRIILARRI